MTTEQLMQPRYLLISDYPNCKNNIGRILTEIGSSNHWDCIDAPSSVKIYMPDKYPHLFRRLHWSEHRKLSDMPGYVKNVTANPITYTKVTEWKWKQFDGFKQM